MHPDAFIQLIFLIFTGAAVIATAALYARQALPVAYIVLGAVVGLQSGLMTDQASYIVQATTILTFIASTYWIVLKVPSPIAISASLRKD